jgi:hypothetical protein
MRLTRSDSFQEGASESCDLSVCVLQQQHFCNLEGRQVSKELRSVLRIQVVAA